MTVPIRVHVVARRQEGAVYQVIMHVGKGAEAMCSVITVELTCVGCVPHSDFDDDSAFVQLVVGMLPS